MLISDLNYLNEVSSESTDLSGGFNQGNDYSNIYFKEYFDVRKYVNSKVYVKGNLATSESDAQAYGKDTLTQTFNNTVTTPYSSHSNGVAISASN
jgi:hypothetical protein